MIPVGSSLEVAGRNGLEPGSQGEIAQRVHIGTKNFWGQTSSRLPADGGG